MAWRQVLKEPVITEANKSSGTPALVADLSVHGVWVPQSEGLFDMRIVTTDAQSYLDRTPLNVLSTPESEKRENTNKHA